MVEHAKAELVGQIARQTIATRDLMVRFDKEYNRLKSEHGWLRFSDVTRTLAHADEAARSQTMNFRLDSSIQHLLLDEFQDTSPDQWRILRRLTQAIMSQKSESSFFCVGDGKQAIYGWRGGVSEILDVVAREVPQIVADQLNTAEGRLKLLSILSIRSFNTSCDMGIWVIMNLRANNGWTVTRLTTPPNRSPATRVSEQPRILRGTVRMNGVPVVSLGRRTDC